MNTFNKNNSAFEEKFTKGYNVGFALKENISLKSSEHTKKILINKSQNKPEDIILLGISSGFSDALHFEKIKRLCQIKDIEQSQSKSPTKER